MPTQNQFPDRSNHRLEIGNSNVLTSLFVAVSKTHAFGSTMSTAYTFMPSPVTANVNGFPSSFVVNGL